MVNAKGSQINPQTDYDKLINSEVRLQDDNEIIYGKVKKLSPNPDGQTADSYDEKSMLNSIIYEFKFEDRHVKEYSANTIAENMLTQVYSYGFTLTMMEEIIEYRKDAETAVTKNNMYIVTKCGQKNIFKTTVIWQLQVQWRDQYESCIHFKY